MSNRLLNETSPYLRQHSDNPVDWYPWCDEAFEKARTEDKPIFLSIGYSTCHWCHVMAHESFEDERTAQILNEHFISIKVDRELRPDIDSVYMSVCQALTGSGGWPMSIFMSWDKKPFFAGTYFPVKARYGMPAFCDLLREIADVWQDDRQALLSSADGIIRHLKQNGKTKRNITAEGLEEKAAEHFLRAFDSINGGFGPAPKFPTPHNLLFLLLYSERTKEESLLNTVEKTLTQMYKGGIFDHIGYGFSRYSTDKYYLAPHFEKMLYDNALIIIAYSAAYSVTDKRFYLDVAEKTAEYILREMTSPEGGFYSAQDADSEGVEGKYYTFTLAEILRVLGEDRGKAFAENYDITEKGNFEGVNIPNLLKSNTVKQNFEDEIKELYSYRKSRTRLHLDDKILFSWNSMMIAALATLYRVSQNAMYLTCAVRAQEYIEDKLCMEFLDDYAYYTAALIELYNSTLEHRYLEKAEQVCCEAVKLFSDDEGYFMGKKETAELFMNPKECYDGATPSGNSVMAYNFVRLYQLTEKEEYNKLAQKQIKYMSAEAYEYPSGYTMFLLAKMMYDDPPTHVTVVTKEGHGIEKLPLLANIAVVQESKEYPTVNGQTTYYVCKGHTCFAPTNNFSTGKY